MNEFGKLQRYTYILTRYHNTSKIQLQFAVVVLSLSRKNPKLQISMSFTYTCFSV